MYNQSGNYVALAGLIVGLLAKIGWIVDTDSITSIISAIIIVVGIIKQHMAHKSLAVVTGNYPDKN